MNEPPLSLAADPLLATLLPTFRDELRKRRDELQEILTKSETESLQGADWDKIITISHKISGTCAPFGYMALKTLSSTCETCIRQHPEEHQKILENVRALIDTCNNVFKDSIPEHTARPRLRTRPEIQQTNRELPVILLADDDAVIRGYMDSLLRGKFELICCDNANECFELAQSVQPDLILLDDQMPGELSGLMLLPKLKTDPITKDIPVMMLTANSKAESVCQAMKTGSIDYIIKPLRADDTFDRISRFLDKRRKLILIIDNDVELANRLQSEFKDAGIRADTETNEGQVFSTIQKLKPSLVIIDRALSGLKGADFLKVITAVTTCHPVPIILLTTASDLDEMRQIINQGVVDCIIKPFEPETLVTRALKILDRQEK